MGAIEGFRARVADAISGIRQFDSSGDPASNHEGYKSRHALPVDFAEGDLTEVTGFGNANLEYAQQQQGEVTSIVAIRTRAGFIQPAAKTEVA